MRELLVVVDMQEDFVRGALGTPEAQAIVPAVKSLVEGAETVVYTKDTHEENYLLTQEGRNLPVPHCLRGSAGWEILPEVFKAGSRVFEKGAFGSLELAAFVKGGGFDRIVLCGVCTDICVVSNALILKAVCPETEIAVVRAACAGVTEEKHEAALETMKSCQVRVL